MAKKAVTKKNRNSAKSKKSSVKKTKSTISKAQVKKSSSHRKTNSAFMKAMIPSETLAAIIGKGPFPRTEVTKRIWDYIKKNRLQDQVNKRMINADQKLQELFGKAKVSMFELTKIVSRHLK